MKKYDNYKDSGIEWIGEIPEHWEIRPLKHLVQCNNEALTEKTNPEMQINYIEIGDVNAVDGIKETSVYSFEKAPSRARRIVREGDVIISTVRTYLKAIASISSNFDGFIASTGFAVLTPKLIDSGFLGNIALCEGLIGEIISLSKGVSYPSITSQDLTNISIPIPTSEEQTAIAKYLDHKTSQIDTLITKKEQFISLLQEERTAVINQAVTKGLDPKVKMKDSDIEWLGEIPEHWEVKKLSFVFKSLNTKRIPLSAEERGIMESRVYDYYGASGIIDKVENFLFDEDLILIGEDGANLLTRSKRLVFIATGKYWVNNHAHIIKPINGNLNYYCEFLELIDYSVYITGSAQPKLTQEALMSIKIIEPPLNEQDEIYSFIKKETNKIDTIITKSQQEIELLKEYKTALISEVVTGKVDVRDVVLN